MNIKVRKSKSQGVVVLPASKSDMHRAIFAACLAKGESIIENITLSDDVNASIDIFRNLGAIITQKMIDCLLKGLIILILFYLKIYFVMNQDLH